MVASDGAPGGWYRSTKTAAAPNPMMASPWRSAITAPCYPARRRRQTRVELVSVRRRSRYVTRMLIMILELLAVGFLLGLGITAVVLAAVSGAETLLRARHAPDGAPDAEVHPLGARPVASAPRGGRAGPGQPRAA
jgi:hypothetical protein